MPDKEAWYFTLSAIPQALAAVIALAAVFVVFKLDSISSRIDQELAILKRFLMPLVPEIEVHELDRLNAEGSLGKLDAGLVSLKKEDAAKINAKYEQLTSILTDLRDEYGHKYDVTRNRIDLYMEQKRNYLHALTEKRKTTLQLLVQSMTATVIPVAVGLILLPNFEYFTDWTHLIPNVISVVGVGAICFTAYSVVKIAKL